MTVVYGAEMESPIGPLLLAATDQGLCNIHFGGLDDSLETLKDWSKKQLEGSEGEIVPVGTADHPVLKEAFSQLQAYFERKLQTFSLPLHMAGTPFQLKVWEVLREVPYGETCTYKDIALAIGQPGAMRAVGGANNRNPVPIVVPCHRVIGAGGKLVGYGGGLPVKIALLDLEQKEWSLV
jgi:methylated-DNA-[protein]-cysteine S-methyltransferase